MLARKLRPLANNDADTLADMGMRAGGGGGAFARMRNVVVVVVVVNFRANRDAMRTGAVERKTVLRSKLRVSACRHDRPLDATRGLHRQDPTPSPASGTECENVSAQLTRFPPVPAPAAPPLPQGCARCRAACSAAVEWALTWVVVSR